MSRIYSVPDEPEKPRIDRSDVASFFEERAKKIDVIGPLHAVIYQDKHPDLAERRNIAEKGKIIPLLSLNGSQRMLDVGCGTGRWAGELLASCAHYHGIDVSEGLIAYARTCFPTIDNCRFTTSSADAFSLGSLGEARHFDRILCAGVLIYLNDDELLRALHCMARALAPNGLIVFREPMGSDRRLTIRQHYSDDLEQTYNAIYRTTGEMKAFIRMAMTEPLFQITGSGDVYDDASLNNRADTRQQWITVEHHV